MKTAKILAAVMALVMCLGVFAACGETKTEAVAATGHTAAAAAGGRRRSVRWWRRRIRCIYLRTSSAKQVILPLRV